MKTPTEYVKMINNNMITNDIIGQVLYSYNKRAKNYRDKKRQYKNTNDHYGNYEKNENKEKEFYKKKEDILKLYKPIEIHKDVKTIIKRKRIYDYEYDKYDFKKLNIINEGRFWDYKNDEFIYFVDDGKEEEIELYFLYYEIGENTFHQPIKNPEKYDLQIIKLEDFYTEGNDITDLLSVQFCDKVYNGLMEGSLEIKEELVAI